MKKYIIYVLCILAFSWGCNPSNKKDSHDGHNHETHDEHTHNHDEHDHHTEEAHSHTHGEECSHDHSHEEDHADEIIFTPQQAEAAGLEYTVVKPSSFSQVIRTSGQILSASGDEITVAATTSGIISFSKASISEGIAVKAGETLVNISSRNIADGDPIAKAASTYQIAQKEYQRAESLISDKLISEKEYNEIKLNYENAKIAYQAFAKTGTTKGVGVSSVISGFIKSKLVTEGQYVDVGQPLLTVAKNQKLQLRADVSERYYKDLKTISSANFRTPYNKQVFQLSSLGGRLVSYGRSAGTQGYYIPVNFEFNNIGDIIEGSYVEVFLLGSERQNILSIPLSSLIENQGLFFVYIQLDAEGYKKQEVKLGVNDGQNVEILSGLKPGDKVVSKGAYHVHLASASASIPHGHEH